MMRKKKHLLPLITISMSLLCIALSGCNDKAISLPVGETVSSLENTSQSNEQDEQQQGMPSAEISNISPFPQNPYSTQEDSGSQEIIYIYVCGAVVSPGVVELAAGSRAQDALEAAGGFAEDARTDYVNLAAKVQDGERLYFPSLEEDLPLSEEKDAAQEKESLVNINTADKTQLCTLPGIGESRAQDIIAYRDANGMFKSKEDIMKVPGIKQGAYAKICDKITIE